MEPSVYLASVLHLRGVKEVLQFEQKCLSLYARVIIINNNNNNNNNNKIIIKDVF